MFSRRIADVLADELPARPEPVADDRAPPGWCPAACAAELQEVMTERVGVLRSRDRAGRRRAPSSPTWPAYAGRGRRRARGRPPTCSPISAALADAAALREETRGSHWREDFPERDDAHWAGHFDVDARRRARPRLDLPAASSTGADSHERRRPTCPPTLRRRARRRRPRPAPRSTTPSSAPSPRTCPGEDVTSAATLDPPTRAAWADLVARGDGVVAGLGRRRAGLPRRPRRRRRGRAAGPPTATGSRAGDVRDAGARARCAALLTAERTALNFACHLSGVATATAALGRRARGHRRAGARHPQDDCPACRALREVRRALRRRRQPPLRRCPTWRWSRTTTCSRPAAWCRPTTRSARATPTCR